MALERSHFQNIPKDAVLLSEKEALKYQTYLLQNWKKSSDVFAFKYGAYALGGATFFSGFFINNHFRRKFKLLNYGRISSYLPIVVMPAALAYAFHTELVLRDLVLMKREQCPVCIELRASAIQAFVGVGFPLIIGPLGCMALSLRFVTFDVPILTKEPKKVFELLSKMIKPIKGVLFKMFVGQALLASIVTYLEASSVIKVNTKLSQIEQDSELISDA